MTDELQPNEQAWKPKSARSEGARNGWKTRQKNKQDAPVKVGGITVDVANHLRKLADDVTAARIAHEKAIDAFDNALDSLTAGK